MHFFILTLAYIDFISIYLLEYIPYNSDLRFQIS